MTAKEAAQRVISHLPEQADWNEIMYKLYVTQKIENGIQAIEAGKTIPHEQIKARIVLP